MKEKIETIAKKYGFNAQIKMLFEEMSELTKAVCKLDRKAGKTFGKEFKQLVSDVTEEIADVNIMIKQLQYFLEIKNEDIEIIMHEKLNRQLYRINNVDTESAGTVFCTDSDCKNYYEDNCMLILENKNINEVNPEGGNLCKHFTGGINDLYTRDLPCMYEGSEDEEGRCVFCHVDDEFVNKDDCVFKCSLYRPEV